MMGWRLGPLAAAVASALLVLTADRASSQIHVGPRLGLTASTIRFEDPATDAQTQALVGVHGGVSLQRALGRRFAVESGLYLSREGFPKAGAHTGALHRDQITTPLLVHIRTATRVSVHLTAGLAGKLALRCAQADVHQAGEVPCDDPVMGAPWRRLDLAGVAGLGVALPVGGRQLTADARLSWGIRDLDGGLPIPGAARSLSAAISFSVLAPWGTPGPGGGS